jgi:hypothetical protein
MKALTVQQPWAWAIFNGKNIENRTQLWKYRGPLAIHAGQRWSDRGGDSDLVTKAWFNTPLTDCVALTSLGLSSQQHRFTYGAILGTVEVVDLHPDAGCCQPWGESAYVEHGGRERRRIAHLVLEDPRPLAEPISCVGALGLWTPPIDVITKLESVK